MNARKVNPKWTMVVILALVLLASALLGVTVASYISAITGSTSTEVATWSIKINGQQIATAETQTIGFNLFDTIYEEDCVSLETNICAGVIAPGTGGHFELKVENLSQVDAEFTLALSEGNDNNIPIQYSTDLLTWHDDLGFIQTLFANVHLVRETGVYSQTIYWRWCYIPGNGSHGGQTDDTDMALVTLLQSQDVSLVINVAISAEQYYPRPDAPDAALLTATNITPTSITLATIDGAEYSVDGMNWQDSPIFENLSPDTTYLFFARYKAVNGTPPSKSVTVSLSTVPCEDFTVTKANRNKIGYADETTDLVIPATFWDEEDQTWYRVTSIKGGNYPGDSNSTFYGCTNLETVSIPDSVTSIGYNAFANCTSLESIIIPDSVTEMKQQVFYGCTNLASATIGSGITVIDTDLFNYCSNLSAVNLPDTITGIRSNAFSHCTKLKNIELPNGVEILDNNAFAFSGLESITIPESVITYVSAFYSCKSLQTIQVSEGNQYYCSVDDVLYNKDKTSLVAYPAGKTDTSYSILPGTTEIVNSAFKDCTNLKSITIPYSVTNIREQAFYDCSTMADIYFTGTEEQWNAIEFGTNWRQNCPATIHIHGEFDLSVETTSQNTNYVAGMDFDKTGMTVTVTYPNGCCDKVLAEDEYTILNGQSLQSDQTEVTISHTNDIGVTTTIPVTITVASDYTAFTVTPTNLSKIGYTDSTTDLVIPATFYDEEDSVWYKVTALQGYHYPASSYCAFYNKDNLTSITIPDTITNWGYYAIYGCDNLTTINIGTGITSWDISFINACTSLTAINFDKNNQAYASVDGVVYNKNKTTLVDFPDGKTSIESFPSSLTTIGKQAFTQSAIISFDMPDTITTVYANAFSSSDLQSVTFSSNLTYIASNMFDSCQQLTNVIIPSTITQIGHSAFYNCSNLTYVIFENPNGWWVSEDVDATSGTSVTVTDPATAASLLIDASKYAYYWWKQS